MDTPTASIIITTFNRPELFKRALSSAQAQTFKDYEIIVVDDCSDEEYQETWVSHVPLNFIRHKKNRGLSAARNTGIKAAKGKYIVCLDDDNELMPAFLDTTIEMIEDRNKDAVTTGRIIRYKKFNDVVVPKLSPFTSMDWGWLIKREVFDHIQYDEDLRANEDTDFGIRFHKKYSRGVFSNALTIAYDTENSLSFPDERELGGMKMFFDKNFHEYKKYPNELRVLYRTMGRKFYRGGHKRIGLTYFLNSFVAKPGLNSFLNLFFILFGWKIYNSFMTTTEFIHAKLK